MRIVGCRARYRSIGLVEAWWSTLVGLVAIALCSAVTISAAAEGQARRQPARSQSDSRDARVQSFYERARSIITKNQNLELSLDQARREVARLHKELEAWSKSENEPLHERSKTYNHNPESEDRPASTELCPLFFAKELDELCPLDETRSEVWGARTVFCRYECLK